MSPLAVRSERSVGKDAQGHAHVSISVNEDCKSPVRGIIADRGLSASRKIEQCSRFWPAIYLPHSI